LKRLLKTFCTTFEVLMNHCESAKNLNTMFLFHYKGVIKKAFSMLFRSTIKVLSMDFLTYYKNLFMFLFNAISYVLYHIVFPAR